MKVENTQEYFGRPIYRSISPRASRSVPRYPKNDANPKAPNQPGKRGTYVLPVQPTIVPNITMPMREFHILKFIESLTSGS